MLEKCKLWQNSLQIKKKEKKDYSEIPFLTH